MLFAVQFGMCALLWDEYAHEPLLLCWLLAPLYCGLATFRLNRPANYAFAALLGWLLVMLWTFSKCSSTWLQLLWQAYACCWPAFWLRLEAMPRAWRRPGSLTILACLGLVWPFLENPSPGWTCLLILAVSASVTPPRLSRPFRWGAYLAAAGLLGVLPDEWLFELAGLSLVVLPIVGSQDTGSLRPLC